jgi:hypothetical protein
MGPHSRSRMLGRQRDSMKRRVVLQWRALQLRLHRQVHECDHRQDKHRRSQGQRDREDRTSNLSDLSFNRISQHWKFSVWGLTEALHGCGPAVERIATVGSVSAVWYNFVRIHKTLKVAPAMEAGVSDRLLSIEDVVGIVDEWETAQRAENSETLPNRPFQLINRRVCREGLII